MRKFIAVAAAAVIVASCATKYVEVAKTEPHATITVQRNYTATKAVDADPYQGYDLMDNPQCENMQKVATFSYDSEFIETVRVSADRKLHFYMHSVPDQDIYGAWCWSYLGFDAENDHDYVIMHVNCTPEVYDKTSGDWVQISDIDVIDGFECPHD